MYDTLGLKVLSFSLSLPIYIYIYIDEAQNINMWLIFMSNPYRGLNVL